MLLYVWFVFFIVLTDSSTVKRDESKKIYFLNLYYYFKPSTDKFAEQVSLHELGIAWNIYTRIGLG
jgi:hypothetical protein